MVLHAMVFVVLLFLVFLFLVLYKHAREMGVLGQQCVAGFIPHTYRCTRLTPPHTHPHGYGSLPTTIIPHTTPPYHTELRHDRPLLACCHRSSCMG